MLLNNMETEKIANDITKYLKSLNNKRATIEQLSLMLLNSYELKPSMVFPRIETKQETKERMQIELIEKYLLPALYSLENNQRITAIDSDGRPVSLSNDRPAIVETDLIIMLT